MPDTIKDPLTPNPAPGSPRPRSVNLMMDHDLDVALDRLAKIHACSRSRIVRECIKHRAGMEFDHLYVCATSNPCLCPQLHVAQQAAAPPPPAAA